ncbi:MAG TPA: hypothetical protein PLG16_05975 [Planctomycetota bacterium]|nr:hypothetical protein [Planctomycetota bacterium]
MLGGGNLARGNECCSKFTLALGKCQVLGGGNLARVRLLRGIKLLWGGKFARGRQILHGGVARGN